MFLKLGILQDEKFYDRVKDLLIWKNNEDVWTTVAEYLERHPEKKVFYAVAAHASPLLQLYKDKKIEILFTASPIDTAVIQRLEEKLSVSFQRIDGACPDDLLDATREKSLLDADGRTEAAKVADFIRASLDRKELEIEAKSLASDQLPALLLLDENQRRFRDYMTLTQGKSATLMQPKKTFIVNTNSKLIQAIHRLSSKQPEIAKEMAQGVYDLSLLAQREVESGEIDRVLSSQNQILEKLASLLA